MKRESFFWIILVFSLIIIACKKSDSLTSTFSADSITNNNVLFAFKIGNWEAYPYFTDSPDEDSFLYTISPTIPLSVVPKFKEIFIKKNDGSIISATKVDSYDARTIGIFFLGDADIGAYNKIKLWWVQKEPGTRPDADSCILR